MKKKNARVRVVTNTSSKYGFPNEDGKYIYANLGSELYGTRKMTQN